MKAIRFIRFLRVALLIKGLLLVAFFIIKINHYEVAFVKPLSLLTVLSMVVTIFLFIVASSYIKMTRR